MSVVAIIGLLAKVSIMMIVFAIGMKATFADATYLFRRPTLLAKAIVSMYVILPLFALLVTFLFDLPLAVEIALVALSLSPVPPILPNKALKAGGEEDYTIGILVTTAVLSVVLLPLATKFFEIVQSKTFNIAIVPVLTAVLSSVLAPLVAGILFKAIAPSLADRLAKPVSLIATIILVIAVIPVLFVSTRSFLTLIGDGTLLALAAMAIVGLISGHLLGGPDPDKRPVLPSRRQPDIRRLHLLSPTLTFQTRSWLRHV